MRISWQLLEEEFQGIEGLRCQQKTTRLRILDYANLSTYGDNNEDWGQRPGPRREEQIMSNDTSKKTRLGMPVSTYLGPGCYLLLFIARLNL